jgi:uncharacterized membrane protein YfcA
MNGKTKKRLLPAAMSVAVGIVNGLLGAGGGMLCVPMLKKCGLDQKSAHASSISVILPLSIFSAVLYIIGGKVSLSDSFAYIPAGVIGAVAGGFLMGKIPDRLLRKGFAIFMLWAGIRLLMRPL